MRNRYYWYRKGACSSSMHAILFYVAVAIAATASTTKAAATADIRDEYVDPCIASEAAFLSKIVYKLDGAFEDPSILESNIPPSKYLNSSWMDVGSTEYLVSRKAATAVVDDKGNTIGIPPGSGIVTFRGSEEIEDWIVNVDQYKVPFGPEGRTIDYSMYQLSEDESDFVEQSISVHRGFNGVFRVYDNIVAKLADLELDDNAALYVNGHSLGGANAQLFAVYYAFANPKRSVYLTTFGQPRTGTWGLKLFAERLQNLNMWRVVYEDDIVTRIPYDEFIHAGHLLWKSVKANFVRSFYRHIGNDQKNFKGVRDFSLAVLNGLQKDSVSELIGDHFMDNYVQWMDSACATNTTTLSSAYFTNDFERLEEQQ